MYLNSKSFLNTQVVQSFFVEQGPIREAGHQQSWFVHSTRYNELNCISMLELKLIPVSKGGSR